MSHPTPPLNPENHPLRVLIVDDSARVRQELGQLLELTGKVQVVGEAENGQEAIRRATELSPEAVIMDLEMPDLDGCAATRQIKQRHPAVRVVILSVHAGPEDERRARAAGADRFVVKGASYQVLLTAILGKDETPISNQNGGRS